MASRSKRPGGSAEKYATSESMFSVPDAESPAFRPGPVLRIYYRPRASSKPLGRYPAGATPISLPSKDTDQLHCDGDVPYSARADCKITVEVATL